MAKRRSKLQNEDGRTQQDTSYRQRYWSGVLKTIYAAQNNVDAYVVLCRETELLPRKENWCNRTTRFFCKEMKHLIKQMNRLFPKVKKLIVHAKIQGKGDHFGIGAVPMRTEQAR
jgi:hypothetical protein